VKPHQPSNEASQQGTEAQCHVGNDASEHTAETGFSRLLASVVHGEVELCVLTSSLRRQVERQHSTRTEDAAAVHQIHQSTLNSSSQRLFKPQSIYAQLVMQTIGQRLTPNGRASRHIVLARHDSNDAGVRNNDSTVALNAASNI